MIDINRSTAVLRAAITQALDALNGQRSILADLERALPTSPPVNAPVEAATVMLGRFGFCQLHKDRLDEVLEWLEVVEALAGAENKRVADLLAYLKSQRQFAN